MTTDTPSALRDAARQLVREKGLARTTTRDLAGVSGANLRSIGYHFGSKDGLMAEVLAEISAEWTAIGVDAARSAGAASPPGERMVTAVRSILTDLAGKRADLLVMLEGILEARHNDGLAASLQQTQRSSLTAIAESVQSGAAELPDEIAEQLARLLMAVHDGLAMQVAVADLPGLRDVDGLLSALAGLGVALAAGLGVAGADDVLAAMIEGAPPQSQ